MVAGSRRETIATCDGRTVPPDGMERTPIVNHATCVSGGWIDTALRCFQHCRLRKETVEHSTCASSDPGYLNECNRWFQQLRFQQLRFNFRFARYSSI